VWGQSSGKRFIWVSPGDARRLAIQLVTEATKADLAIAERRTIAKGLSAAKRFEKMMAKLDKGKPKST
jgi:hypothetical protein